jgi:hypothetical protein
VLSSPWRAVLAYVFKASPRCPGVGKSWASKSPRLQPVWHPPQAPWRHLGGVSRRLDVVVRKLDAIPSLLREAWDAGRFGRRACVVAWRCGSGARRNKPRRWRSGAWQLGSGGVGADLESGSRESVHARPLITHGCWLLDEGPRCKWQKGP